MVTSDGLKFDNEDDIPSMVTWSGKFINLRNPNPDVFNIEDIAHHLSLICRFSGATKEFYSVAQHSVLVASLIGKKDYLAALLHDAVEAYTGDIVRPLKYLIPEFKIVEDNMANILLEKFNCFEADWDAIKEADNSILATEARDLLKHKWLPNLPEPIKNLPIVGWRSDIAEQIFLKKYYMGVEQLANTSS